MRWITFAILLYIAAALQTTHLLALSARMDYPAIEYVPLLAIFCALFATEDVAPLCGFWCGLTLDLISDGQPFGAAAVPLALVAYAVVKVRMSIFREHLISQVIVAFFGILLFAALSGLFRTAITPADPSRGAMFWSIFFPLAMNAIYSAALAPLLFWGMLRLRPILGFEPPRGRKR